MRPVDQSSWAKKELPTESFHLDTAVFSDPGCDTTCGLFGPLHYEPGYTYPLIVWLHGCPSDERQLMRVMPLISMRNYVATAPRGLPRDGVFEESEADYSWDQSDECIYRAEERIFDCIDIASRKFSINRRKIFLVGFDGGGTMAFRVGMNNPSAFAGVASLCGSFPSGRTPFGNLTLARRLPILLSVGQDSTEYPPEAVCKDLRLFHTAGLSIALRQYSTGHELSAQMLGDVDRWIMEQISSAGTRGPESDSPKLFEL